MRTRKHVALLVVGAMAIGMLGAGLASAAGFHPLVKPADATFSGTGSIPLSKIHTCTGTDGDTYAQEPLTVHGTQTSGLPGTPSGKIVVTGLAVADTAVSGADAG